MLQYLLSTHLLIAVSPNDDEGPAPRIQTGAAHGSQGLNTNTDNLQGTEGSRETLYRRAPRQGMEPSNRDVHNSSSKGQSASYNHAGLWPETVWSLVYVSHNLLNFCSILLNIPCMPERDLWHSRILEGSSQLGQSISLLDILNFRSMTVARPQLRGLDASDLLLHPDLLHFFFSRI